MHLALVTSGRQQYMSVVTRAIVRCLCQLHHASNAEDIDPPQEAISTTLTMDNPVNCNSH
eukprot:619417-Amphidinium_carterae.2